MIFTKQEADETAEEENLTPPDKQPLVKASDLERPTPSSAKGKRPIKEEHTEDADAFDGTLKRPRFAPKLEAEPDEQDDVAIVDSIMARLENGGWRAEAWGLSTKIGLDLRKEPSKIALRRFCERYTQTDKIGHFYTMQRHPQGFSAVLTVPAFYNRTFHGGVRATEYMAEASAADAFQRDADAQKVARKLPPSLTNIWKAVKLQKYQRIALERAGVPWKDIEKQIVHEVFMGFQNLGCRTALWDGNC